MIDGSFAANACVYLCQERSRHLHEWQTPLECGSGEAGNIANHPAAKRNQRRAPLDMTLDQPVVKKGQPRKIFVFLASRYFDDAGIETSCSERCHNPLSIYFAHHTISHHRYSAHGSILFSQKRTEICQETSTDANRVRTRAKIDSDNFHRQ